MVRPSLDDCSAGAFTYGIPLFGVATLICCPAFFRLKKAADRGLRIKLVLTCIEKVGFHIGLREGGTGPRLVCLGLTRGRGNRREGAPLALSFRQAS